MSPFWLKLLPAFIQKKISHRRNLINALNNTGWLFADKIIRMGMGVVVGIWIARYLGPEQFGLLNYVMAVVALFGAVASMGLNGIVVRDLVKGTENINETLGSAFTLQVIGGGVAFVLAVFFITLSRPNDNLAKLIVVVLGSILIIRASDIVKYWYESQVLSRYVVWPENGIFLIVACVKVGLIFTQAPLMAFVWATFAEGALAAVGLFGIYVVQNGTLGSWRASYARTKTLLRDSWPLILSGLAIMVYMRIDQIMLGQMLGDESVGVYSAAVRISEVWYFAPMAIISSVFPAMLDAKKLSIELYRARFQRLLDYMWILALCVAVPMTFLSEWFVEILYGRQYSGAGIVLAIHVWTGVFVFSGLVAGRWLLAEELQRYSFYRTLAGAVMNIALNFSLIPNFGVAGAAWATVISQACASVFFNGISPQTRGLFFMQLRAMIGMSLWRK